MRRATFRAATNDRRRWQMPTTWRYAVIAVLAAACTGLAVTLAELVGTILAG